MPITSVIFGSLLILIGIIGFGVGYQTDSHAHFTALIPAAFGILMAILGFAAKSNEGLRKHFMHAAVLIALIGFISTAAMLLIKFREFALNAANISKLSMSFVCLLFVVLAIKSFVAARQGRT